MTSARDGESSAGAPRAYRPGFCARAWEGLCGYVPAGRWRLYRLGAEERRRWLLPSYVPVPFPKTRLRGFAGPDGRIPLAVLAAHSAAFLRAKPRHGLAWEVKRFIEKAPFVDEIETAMRAGRMSDAAGPLRKILAIDPEDAGARLLLGSVLLIQGDGEGAGACFEALGSEIEDDPLAQTLLGRAAEARGDIEEARSRYRRALELAPGHALALERLTALGDKVEVYLGTLAAPERAFIPAEDYESFIEEQWKSEEHDAEFYLERSRFHLRQGNSRLALRAAHMAGGRATAQAAGAGGGATAAAQAAAARCRAEIALGLAEEARLSLARLEELDPGSGDALSCRAHLLWMDGRREEAAAALRRALAVPPTRQEDLLLYLHPGYPDRPGAPLETLQRLDKEQPESPVIKSVMASLQMALGQWEAGAETAVSAARLGASPESLVEITGRLGRAGRDGDVGRVAQAAGGWRRLLSSDALLRCNLAVSYGRLGESEAARALWRSVLHDARAHPRLRLRAKEALAALASPPSSPLD